MFARRFLWGAVGVLFGLGIATSVAPAALLEEESGPFLGHATTGQRRIGRIALKADQAKRRVGPHVLAQVQPVKLVNLTKAYTQDDRLPSFSETGRRIAFVSRRTGFDRIWSMDIDGSDPQQITTGTGSYQDSYPAMSPGGQFVAYASNRFGTWDLFLRDIARGTDQRLTFWNNSDEIEPAWSPLGNDLAFSTNHGDPWGRYHIWLIGTHTGNARRLTDTVFEERHACWNPIFPQFIIYTGTEPHGDRNIWMSEVGNPTRYQIVFDGAEDFDPTWDPLGLSICFVSDRGGDNDLWLLDVFDYYTLYFYGELVLMPEDPITNPASNAFGYGDPAWLPRTANDVDPSWRPLRYLFVWDSFYTSQSHYPRIAFTSDKDGNNDIWLLAPDDLTPPNINYDVDESPLVRVTPQQSHPGETVTITAAVSDNESGVDRVFAAVKSADAPMYVTVLMTGVLEGAADAVAEIKEPADYLMIDGKTGKPYNQVAPFDPSTLVYGPLYPPPDDGYGYPYYEYSDRMLTADLNFIDHCLELVDDGGVSGSGDAVAGDHVYTGLWRIPTSSDNLDYDPACDYYLDIIAWDRAGNLYSGYEYWGEWDVPHQPTDDLPPNAYFSVDRHYASPGETITFDAECDSMVSPIWPCVMGSFDPSSLRHNCQNNQGVCEQCEYELVFPGGSIAEYRWDFGDGSIIHQDATSIDFISPVVTHAYTEPGVYTATLTIWDGGGLTDVATEEITIVADVSEMPDNLPPVACFTEDIHNPQFDDSPDDPCDNLVIFDGSSSYDEDGDDIVMYEWDFDGYFPFYPGLPDYVETPDNAPDGAFDGIYNPYGMPPDQRFVYINPDPDNPWDMIWIATLTVTDARGADDSFSDWIYVGDLSKYRDGLVPSIWYDSFGFDNVAGFTAREFAAGGPHNWLLVNDYGCGQKFRTYSDAISGYGRNWPTYYIAEDYWTADAFVVSQHQWPEEPNSLLMPRCRFRAFGDNYSLSYAGDYTYYYDKQAPRAIGNYPYIWAGTSYWLGVSDPEPYDEWRVLCRGPIDLTILEDYLPYEVVWEDTGPGQGRNVMHAPKAVIWASPYSGDLRVQRGTITDPETWERLMAFLDDGGRLFMHGQDIAWAMTKDGQQSNTLLNNYFHVAFGENDAYDRYSGTITVNARYRLVGQLINGYSITDNFWEDHGSNACAPNSKFENKPGTEELWTTGHLYAPT
jgi:hypothetical protein